MPNYIVKVKQLVGDDELRHDDREDGPDEEYEYEDMEDEDAVLDLFHDNVPIKTLEHYEITVEETT